MEKAYAEALWGMVKSGKDPQKSVEGLRDALMERGRLALMPRIARAFGEIAERAAKQDTVTLTVAKENDVHKALKEAHAYLEKMGVEKDDVKTRVDETLIGGWRLDGRERLVDASYKNELLALYNRITNA